MKNSSGNEEVIYEKRKIIILDCNVSFGCKY